MMRALACVLAAVSLAAQQAGENVIVSAASVRLRSAPSESAPVARIVPLGTQMMVVSRQDGWVEVAENRKSFIRAEFLRTFTPETLDAVRESIARERLARRARASPPPTSCCALRSLLVPTWRIVRRSGADAIAWLAVENGLPGECEGDPGCHATVASLLFGEYLNRHPAGKHRDEALKEMTTWLDYGSLDGSYLNDRKELCGRMMAPLAALQSAVSKTSAAGASKAMQSIERLIAVCR